jgi:hypothetical protein
MVLKKVPGAGDVYMIYDNRDRLVFTQDAELRRNSNWLTTLYDRLNRPISTGMITYGGTRDALQAYVNQNTGSGYTGSITVDQPIAGNLFINQRETGRIAYQATSNIVFNGEFVSETSAEFTAEIVEQGISSSEVLSILDNPLPPGSNFTPLTITYFDNYTFTNIQYDIQYNSRLDPGNNLNAEPMPSQNSHQTMGMVTGTKVRVLESVDNWQNSPFLTTVNFYDERSRVVQT